MYRNMSQYGKQQQQQQQQQQYTIDTTDTAGLDQDYDYSHTYGNSSNSRQQQDHVTTTKVSTPTPTSASARGIHQNAYYNASGHHQNEAIYGKNNASVNDNDGNDNDDDNHNQIIDEHLDLENDDDQDMNNQIHSQYNHGNELNQMLPQEEDMVQYDTREIVDPVVVGTTHYTSNNNDNNNNNNANDGTVEPPPVVDTGGIIDTSFNREQMEQLQFEAERLKGMGNKHMASQEYNKAYHAYSAALQLSPVGPNSHVYLSNRAAALLSLKRYTAAVTDAKRAIALAPTFGKAHARLGQALYFLKEYQNAVIAYEDALLYEPDNAVTRAYLDKAKQKLIKQQQSQSASVGGGVTVRSGEDNTTVLSGNSTTVAHTVQNSIATDPMMNHTIVQQPYTASTPSALAALQQAVIDKEVQEATTVAKIGSSNDATGTTTQRDLPTTTNNQQNENQMTGNKNNNKNDSTMDNTMNDDPEFIEALRIQQRANQYLVTKQYRQAIEEYTAALFLVPDDVQLSPDLHLGRAHALNGSRRHESAKNDALLALKIQPNSAAAYSTLAKSLFYLKDYYGAVAAFDNCKAQLPPDEDLGLFDQAYLEKALRALEEEESSLGEAGKPSSQLNRSYQSTESGKTALSTNAVIIPKLPPPRFVPREEAMQQQSITPPARTMPKQWPKQSPTSLNVPLRCGPERAVICISEALGLKLNRGSDGIVRVLSVSDANDVNQNVHILRRGTVNVGDIIREAAGVDIRRPITNVMWGDTVALLRMAPRPITIIVAPELSPTPKTVLLEQQRAVGTTSEAAATSAATNEVPPPSLLDPSPSSGDEPVPIAENLAMVNDPDLNLVPDDDDDEDIVECGEDDDNETSTDVAVNESKDSIPKLETITETTDDEGTVTPQANSSGEDNIDIIEGEEDNDDGIESVEDEISPPSNSAASTKTKKSVKAPQSMSMIDQDVVFENATSSLRLEEDRIVGGEILFQRETTAAYAGWDTLRWMSYNGARKVNLCQLVFKLEDGGKRKGLPLFWKSGNKQYAERALIVYDEPSLMMIVRRPTSLEEIRNLLGLPDMSNENDASSDMDDWAINPDTAMKSYWILESVVDPKTSKLRLSSLTTPTSISPDSADDRERSCFHLLTPAETISLSAVNVRTEAKKSEQSFQDSGAFLETFSIETSIAQAICGSHHQKSDLGDTDTDIAWKHQVITGSLHSLVISGNQKILDDGIAHAKLSLSKGRGITDISTLLSTKLPPRIIDAVDENGYTALYYACSSGMESAIRSLITAGADVTFRFGAHGLTILHLSARRLNDKTLSTILSATSMAKKLDANIPDKKGRTPMYVAMVEGSVLDGGKSPDALGRCMVALSAWGGSMMTPSTTMTTTNAASPEILRNPISALAYMWQSDYLSIGIDHASYRFPLSLNGIETPMSLAALYQYPIHSALIALRKHLRKGTSKPGTSMADRGLLPTLTVLLERGFEPNERLDTRAFGSTRTSFDEFFGYAPIHILAILALEMDSYKAELNENSLRSNLKLISDTAELLLKYGARLSLDPPLAERSREKITDHPSNYIADDLDETASAAVSTSRRTEILTKKVESDKVVMQLMGGEKHLLTARKEWCNLKKVATTVERNLIDDNTVLDNSIEAGGSDTVSCAICWSVFGAIMNRKHKCRVSAKYVCDDCSAKRLVQVCSEYRISDGQFNLARYDAVNEQQGRIVKVAPPVKQEVAISTSQERMTSSSDSTSFQDVKCLDESRRRAAAVRLDRLEAEKQSNRESLFGNVLEAASNFVLGNADNETTLPSSPSRSSSSNMNELTSSLEQTRDAFAQRGERLSTLSDKTAKMVDASADFAKMASELKKQSEKGFFW